MTKKRRKKNIVLSIVAVVFIATLALMGWNKIGPLGWVPWGDTNNSGGVGVAGYDPISYIESGKAEAGDASLSYTWNEVEWRFVSQEHLDAFKAKPEAHAPQLGGYCAAAVAFGMTADIEPDSWHVEDGKLYLFFNDAAKKSFENGISDGIISKAEQNWKQR